ncbi:MAG: TetR/AcrR family transcriptional regulator [Puniceicoccales bacterium]|jgi:AcrR family transcriptional regulator|nr:TetR/AcrR family transcriptional regulator [Puniceicoccales bacterium]
MKNLHPKNPRGKAAVVFEDTAGCERITNAASRLFFSRGYNALTMDALAYELGMSKKTLYQCFSSKEDIVGAVIENFAMQFRKAAEDILDKPKCRFLQRIQMLAELAISRFALLNPVLLHELQRYSPALYQRFEELRGRNFPEIWKRLLKDGVESGAVRPDIDVDFSAQLVLRILRGVVTDHDALHAMKLTSREALVKTFDVLARGLLSANELKSYKKISFS